MPNWCEGELSVKSESRKGIFELAQFKSKMQGENGVLDMNKVIPCPKWFQTLNGFNQGGYEWCCEHWGTKWNFCEPILTTEQEMRLVYSFHTAWSPCLPVIKEMSVLFPSLTFSYKYWERGMGFRGHFIVKGGIVRKHKEYEYKGDRGG